MSVDSLVKPVEQELLRLARAAPNWESVKWLSWVGDCFDGGDFDVEDFGNLRWRLEVLRGKLGPTQVDPLIDLCQAVLDGERAKRRNERSFLGNLRQGVEAAT